MSDMVELLKKYQIWLKRVFVACFDVLSICFSAFFALLLRFDLSWSGIEARYLDAAWDYLPFNIVITLIIFWIFRLYHSLWSYAGMTEMQNILSACVLSSAVQFIAVHLLRGIGQGYPLPRAYYFLYCGVLLVCVAGSRFLYRAIRLYLINRSDGGSVTRVMVVGAGDTGHMIIREILNSSQIRMKICCVIDDDKSKKGSYVHGIKVVGTRDDILASVEKHHIQEIIIAIPSATRTAIKELVAICKETECQLKITPGMDEIVNGQVSMDLLRDVSVEDLLGREPVRTDIDSIMGYVKDKVVMITGGGGSIGSELCRQIAGHQPKQLVIVDIYENNAYDIQQELKMTYPDLDQVVLIASVRNTKRIDEIFSTYRPNLVYHAAAHKHVPLMEDSPNEAIKNNVLGTWKVVQAADKYNVDKFVLISTDKAVNPTNVMGASKRICEMIVQTWNKRSKTDFVAVRFGNVLGSNGSVIPLFKKQIAAGGPVTVVHPDIIRYFMTIPEAISLVLQAGAYAKGGEIFVLEMGKPVKILDLATNLIKLSGLTPGEDIEIIFTGLRPGEKLYEELLMEEEGMQETANKLIHIGKPIELDEELFVRQLAELKTFIEDEPTPKALKAKIKELVPTYQPKAND